MFAFHNCYFVSLSLYSKTRLRPSMPECTFGAHSIRARADERALLELMDSRFHYFWSWRVVCCAFVPWLSFCLCALGVGFGEN
jgi:hypothetical protein